MKRSALAVAITGLVLVPLSGARAIPLGSETDVPPGVDKQATVKATETYNWDGSVASGLNQYYWDPVGLGPVGPLTDHTCTKQVETYCDVILFEFSNPLTPQEIAAGKKSKTKGVTITADTFSPTDGPVTDFDLLAYESDPGATVGALLDSDGNLQNTTQEQLTFSIVTTPTEPSKWVVLHVVYYQVVNGTYKGHAKF
jgi:hypothetical protein